MTSTTQQLQIQKHVVVTGCKIQLVVKLFTSEWSDEILSLISNMPLALSWSNDPFTQHVTFFVLDCLAHHHWIRKESSRVSSLSFCLQLSARNLTSSWTFFTNSIPSRYHCLSCFLDELHNRKHSPNFKTVLPWKILWKSITSQVYFKSIVN